METNERTNILYKTNQSNRSPLINDKYKMSIIKSRNSFETNRTNKVNLMIIFWTDQIENTLTRLDCVPLIKMTSMICWKIFV